MGLIQYWLKRLILNNKKNIFLSAVKINCINRSALSNGFTLIEVMVALTIFAALAATISSVSSSNVNQYIHLRDKTLAGFVAENQITTMRYEEFPDEGFSKITTTLGGQEWFLEIDVSPKSIIPNEPKPLIHEITVSVFKDEDRDNSIISLYTIQGRKTWPTP
jgi:general secretion pathway protein I